MILMGIFIDRKGELAVLNERYARKGAEFPGGNGKDTFRIKIVDKTSGKLVYDNLIGAADDANPTTVLTSGSITITKP